MGGGRAILKFAWILFRAGCEVGLDVFWIVSYRLGGWFQSGTLKRLAGCIPLLAGRVAFVVDGESAHGSFMPHEDHDEFDLLPAAAAGSRV